VGNIVLKTCESMARGMFSWLKAELMATAQRKIGAYLAKDAFRVLKKRLDSESYGGAPLLGLNGIVMKAHASASEVAIMNAIRTSTEALEHNVNNAIVKEMERASSVLVELNATE